jgi:hypothetical protein
MKLTERAYLSLRLSLQVVSPQEMTRIRLRHAGQAFTSLAYAAAGIGAATIIGFAIPSVAFGTEWPSTNQLHTMATQDMLVHAGFAGLAACWGAKKLLPRVGHHVRMIRNPKTETIIRLQESLQTLFTNTLKLCISLASFMIPTYLACKTIYWLILS